MEEKICEILKKGEMSISDIRDNLGDVGRSQLIGLLSDMVEKEIIFKKVVDDRSYYYLKSEDKSDKKLEADEIESNNKFENDKYSFDIPSSFKMIKEDDRDFVAYLPNGKGDYNDGGADVIIFASSYISVPSDKIKRMIPEVRSTLYEVTFWGAGDMLNISDDVPEYEMVNIGYDVGLITGRFGSQYNFYFICPLGNEYKQMRIVIESSVGPFSKLREMAINLMRGFSPKCEIDDIPNLNDDKYMNGLNSFLISEWIGNIKDIDLNIKVLLNLVSKCEKNRYDYLKYDKAILEERLRKRIKWVSSIFDRYLIQAYEFIKRYKEEDLTSIYYYLNLFIGNCGELKVNLEGKIISEVSSKVQDIYYEIFDENILKMIEGYEPLGEEDFDFIKNSRDEFNDICKDWDSFKDSYLDDIDGKEFNSEFSLKLEVNSIRNKAFSFGERFEKLLFILDEWARSVDDEEIIKNTKKLISDIFKAFDMIHLDFTACNLKLDDFDYAISKDAVKIRDYWLGESKSDFDIENEEENYEKELLEIQKLNDKAVSRKNEKLNSEYSSLIKNTDDEIKKLRRINLDILEKIDGLSKINFRKKDKLNKEIEANNQDIEVLENKLKAIKNELDKERENIKGDYAVPIRPKEVYEKLDSLVETDESLETYMINKKYKNDIIEELTYISKEVTVSELLELSDKLSILSNSKLSSLLSQLEKEGRVCKNVISKKTYYSANENYADKLNIKSDYPFGEDVWKVYNNLKEHFKSIDKLSLECDLSKVRVMQCVYYLIGQDKVYIKDDIVYLR